ncbi:MAG: hypothetical protein ILO68_01175, partial [Clostridia bacterium]|nr:hypothetical protein [Clostridia bacterium]
MKRIRTISFALIAVLLVLAAASVLSALPHSAKADTGMVVSSRNPAILADVGEIITLGDYSVEFGSTVADAGAITWKKDGSPVTSICPDKKGVTPLTAQSGSSEKTVYLIAKQPDETDYVLYENDFSGTKADLDSEGWVFLSETTATVSDGQLHLGTRSQGYARAILPAFIGDFSGYGIEAVATQTDCTDTARWCSLVYHIQNANGQYYPYYHMCVRNNTTSNTIEFAERTTANQWYVITTISKSMDMKDPHTLKIACYDNVVQYFFDGESVFYTANAGAHDTGYAGLTCNYGTMNVDTLRVTLLLDKPEKPIEKPQLVDTSGNRPDSNITNYVSNHAYITSMADAVATFRGSTLPVAVLFNPGDRDVSSTDVRTVLSGCVSFNVIPEFQLSKTSEIDLLVSAMDKAGTPEAVVVGP